MKKYRKRNIQFRELVEINDWKIKVYTISEQGEFTHELFYQNVLKELPKWLMLENRFVAPNIKIAFLILHPGAEGIFSLINWWVGDNMLNTNVFISDLDKPTQFDKISGNGLGPCVWELEIINHESISWTNHILKEVPNSNFKSYLEDVINVEI